MGNGALTRAVFLDRDGVINEPIVRDGRPYPPSLDEVRVVDGALEALQLLKSAGFGLYVVTNQPDIARGTVERTEVDAINAYLGERLPIDRFFICPHDDADGCLCRKPLPGMITEAARAYSIDLASSYLVGDRAKDIAAGHAAGVRSVFINRGYREPSADPAAHVTVDSIAEAADWIMRDRDHGTREMRSCV